MRLNDALENEKNRKESESWNKIYLHKDGKFFHAYEWSAWLIKAFVCTEGFQKERGDSKMLSAFLYKTKNTEYIILGFLGTLVHNKSFNIRRDLFFKEKYLGYGVFDEKITKLERVNA